MNTTLKKGIAGVGIGGTLLFGGGITADQIINPYDQVGTKLEITADSVVPEAGEVKNIVSTDEPKITLSKWDGEVSLGVKSLDLAPQTEGSRPFLSKNVEWTDGNVKMEAVPLEPTATMEDGGMEINLILDSQPASNVFTFQLDNWENLDFFYQPALTDEEIKQGESRPENVVGSYAVYYKNHANHIEGQTNYATGKAYHIFRPLVTDNSGNTVWADVSYTDGVLIVAVPQSFLDSASYPVKVDPTFGYTTQGGTANNMFGGSTFHKYGMRGVAINGTLTDVDAYLSQQGTALVVFALYSESSSLPNSSLVSGSLSVSGVVSLRTKTLSTSMTGSNYWAVVSDDNDDPFDKTSVYSDTGGTGALTNDAVVWGADATNRYSIYATYTASGGGGRAIPAPFAPHKMIFQ